MCDRNALWPCWQNLTCRYSKSHPSCSSQAPAHFAMPFSAGRASRPISTENIFPKPRVAKLLASILQVFFGALDQHIGVIDQEKHDGGVLSSLRLREVHEMRRFKLLLPLLIFTTAVSMLAQIGVGANPTGIAADANGNIWVANWGGNSVTKIHASTGTAIPASTGTVVGTYPVGINPIGVAWNFNTNSIWVANSGSNTVTKLDANTGTALGTYIVGSGAQAVISDGLSIWVTNAHSASVTRLMAVDGSLLGTFGVGLGPVGLAFDGKNIWVANRDSNTISKISAMQTCGGATLLTIPVASQPQGLA